MEFIDSHAHLNDPAFDADRLSLIKNLSAHQVVASVEIGCSPEEWLPALALSKQFPSTIFPALGVHPEYAPKVTPQCTDQLAKLLQDPCVKAVGEIGLDYTCLEIADKTLQNDTFTQMLSLSNKAEKPIVLHVRREGENYEAYTDTFSLLQHNWQAKTHTQFAGVLHCFCARYEEAKQALDMGLLLGINGCFTYKKNEYIREAVKKVGADKIILETDCPYLSPQGKRGTRNDPSNIPLIGQFVADYLDISLEQLSRQTTLRAKQLYGLP